MGGEVHPPVPPSAAWMLCTRLAAAIGLCTELCVARELQSAQRRRQCVLG
jgi:hypothetical protein